MGVKQPCLRHAQTAKHCQFRNSFIAHITFATANLLRLCAPPTCNWNTGTLEHCLAAQIKEEGSQCSDTVARGIQATKTYDRNEGKLPKLLLCWSGLWCFMYFYVTSMSLWIIQVRTIVPWHVIPLAPGHILESKEADRTDQGQGAFKLIKLKNP